ncbi:MAG: hypothetical protein WCK58_00370 [Chloroflexota bacterium]
MPDLSLVDSETVNPGRVLHRTDEWVMGPAAPYKVRGDVSKVVFPSG